MGDRKFALTIAFFNSLGYMVTSGVTTYVDARLLHHVVSRYRARHYPMGYWILLLGPALFVLTYIAIQKTKTFKGKIVSLVIIVLSVGFLSLLNFQPEFPHPEITTWMIMYSICGAVSVWIRFGSDIDQTVEDMNIPWEFKVEYLKERATFWRALAIAIGIGYVALAVPWTTLIFGMANKITTSTKEMFLFRDTQIIIQMIFTAYVLVGVIFESFRKSNDFSGLLLRIKKQQ